MPITTPVYATREAVMAALDFKESARNHTQVDRAVESASRDIEGIMHRRFYPEDLTKSFSWPNYQLAAPWRLWLNQNELAAAATSVTSGGIVIPLNQIFFEPANSGPPYNRIELDRSTSAAFGLGATPQRSILITGTWGYGADKDPAGALAAAMTDTTGTSVTVTNSALVGTGSILYAGTERMLVTDRGMADTGQAQQGAGCSTAAASDVALTVTDGTKYAIGEVLLLNSERMLIVDIAGNVLTVKRAWDGTVLATHTAAEIFAPRLLTVTRGALGTTAATHSSAAPLSVHRVPSAVRDLCIALALNQVLSETSGYARTVGSGDTLRNASGAGLAYAVAQATGMYGRKGRQRAV